MKETKPTPQADEPCVIVIFGASGDLTKRKLIPSLYNLATYGLLPKNFAIVGVSLSEWSDDQFRDQLGKDLVELGTQKVNPDTWNLFRERMFFCVGKFDDDATYQRLAEKLTHAEQQLHTKGNVLFYLSVQPGFFAPISEKLAEHKLTHETDGKWRRVIIEKPFGHDLDSARQLNAALTKVLAEKQIFRIDHYLGKETAQNILVFRLGNSVFEPIWNRRYIDHVQLTVAESIGVEQRGAFYEGAGAFRDVIQNHMFMLMALIAMEPPHSLEGEDIRNKKVEVLRSIRKMTVEEVQRNTARGQYTSGLINEEKVAGYRHEPNVSPTSNVETFAALKIMIDNWRWAGVPFYLRSGKRLKHRTTKIAIRFKAPPLSLFGGKDGEKLASNYLIFYIQPEEGVTFQARAKVPGPTITTSSVHLDFDYGQFGNLPPTTGYEKLLYDCMVGDTTLFHRSDMVEAAWEAAQPILDGWNSEPSRELPMYMAGTWGPAEADELMARDGFRWWTTPK